MAAVAIPAETEVRDRMIERAFDNYTDDDLRRVIAKCSDILSERDRSRKEEALRKANELLKGAGLNPREFVEVKKQKRVGRSTGGREKK